MSLSPRVLGWLLLLALVGLPGLSRAASARTIAANRTFEVLAAKASPRQKLAKAAARWGDRVLVLDDVRIDARVLAAAAATPADEPLERAVRELLRRPVDLEDLLLFLDDVLAARDVREVFMPAGRARSAGILVHPDDVFLESRPRQYARRPTRLPIERPERPSEVAPAADGAPLGPGWTARYPNLESEAAMLTALAEARPDFARRVRSLVTQLREQGAEVHVESTLRPRHRGYLMWGSFFLSRARHESEVRQRVNTLKRLNRAWDLHVPILWAHPGGWRATRNQARRMAEAYQVAYATRGGARDSDHYDGRAVDVTCVGLPRRLHLVAPDGSQASFDLSASEQPRDLNLTPQLIKWVEQAFGLDKLEGDYPHWSDARPDGRESQELGPEGSEAPAGREDAGAAAAGLAPGVAVPAPGTEPEPRRLESSP